MKNICLMCGMGLILKYANYYMVDMLNLKIEVKKAFMMKMVVNDEFINLINIIQKCIGTINRR